MQLDQREHMLVKQTRKICEWDIWFYLREPSQMFNYNNLYSFTEWTWEGLVDLWEGYKPLQGWWNKDTKNFILLKSAWYVQILTENSFLPTSPPLKGVNSLKHFLLKIARNIHICKQSLFVNPHPLRDGSQFTKNCCWKLHCMFKSWHKIHFCNSPSKKKKKKKRTERKKNYKLVTWPSSGWRW